MQANRDDAERWPVLMGLAALILTAGGLFGAMMAEIESMRPTPGDIVSFTGGQTVPPGFTTTTTAQREEGGSCVLDPRVIAMDGGSLVVEGTQAGRRLLVHWAGRRSSAEADCGHSASLVLPEDALDNLAAAAGGYGVTHKALALASMPINPAI